MEYSVLEHIPTLIMKEENDSMILPPERKEVRENMFKHNENNTSGPDEFISAFFQTCWDIVGDDITRLMRAFFCG